MVQSETSRLKDPCSVGNKQQHWLGEEDGAEMECEDDARGERAKERERAC